MLCLSSRNIIDKTMCEVLWWNISDFYVNLWVEVGKQTPTGNFRDVFTPTWIWWMLQPPFSWYDNVKQKDASKRNLCYIYSFVWFWNIGDHWFKQEKREKGWGLWILQLNKYNVSTVSREKLKFVATKV
jgi:hypothetical protein